jgi:ribonuclease J
VLNVEYKYGNTLIRIKQGYKEIGGNFIIIENKDNTLVFDQGIRFSRFKKYYNVNIQPSSASELKRLGIIPPSDEFNKIYISHLHLDHLGVLHLLNVGTLLYVPDKDTFNQFIEPYKESDNWTAYISPPIGVNVIDIKDNQDGVLPLQVEHSAYPAYSFYYNNGDVRILYSGDLRLSSPLKVADQELHNRIHEKTILEEYEERGLDTDILIIEGTNFSSAISPLQPHYFNEQVNNIFESHSNSLITVSIDPIDLEELAYLLLVTKEKGKIPVFSGRRLIKMASFWTSKFNLIDKAYQFDDKSMEFEIIDEDEIIRSPQDYVIFTVKGNLIDFGRRLSEIIKGSVVISLSTENKAESGEDESVEDNWYKALGFITYRLRISGHYYPYELRTILEYIKPKKVIPIHTDAPLTMCEYINKLGYSCAENLP